MSGPQANRSDMHTDDLAMAPLGSCLMYDVLSDVEILRIQLWTEDWFRMVLEQKLTQWPHSITGLTPEEGVKYYFGMCS
jgi:hypothetical protein